MVEIECEWLRSNPKLPEECMREIVSQLNPKEWCRGCAVSQKFHKASEFDENWVTFLPLDWLTILSKTSVHLHFTSLKQLYLHLSDNPIIIDGIQWCTFLVFPLLQLQLAHLLVWVLIFRSRFKAQYGRNPFELSISFVLKLNS